MAKAKDQVLNAKVPFDSVDKNEDTVDKKEKEQIGLSRHRRLAWLVVKEITSNPAPTPDSKAAKLRGLLKDVDEGDWEPGEQSERVVAEAFDAAEPLFQECAEIMNWRQKDTVGLDTVGLALSGGGIRSATFNLGVLQGLAELRYLPRIDYLSTVSGGGYIGSWLAAWLQRSSLGEVMQGLHPDWKEHRDGKTTPQIEFLRDYSNYLTPRVGLLTADTWTAVAIFARNLLLNLAILVSAAIGLLLLPHWLVRMADPLHSPYALVVALALLFVALVIFAWPFLPVAKGPKTPPAAEQATTAKTPPAAGQGTIVAVLCLFWLVGVYMAVCWASGNPGSSSLAWVCSHLKWLVVLPVCLWLAVGIVPWVGYGERAARVPWVAISWSIISLLSYIVISLGGASWVLSELAVKWKCDNPHAMVTWGVPLVMLVHLSAAGLQVGLTGMLLRNEAREWLARLTAWVLILCVAWVSLFAVAIYGPLGILHLQQLWLRGTITLAWLLHTASGVWSAFSSKSGQRGSSNLLDRLAVTAPPVFLLGLFLLLSFGIYNYAAPATSAPGATPAATVTVAWTTETDKGSLTVTQPAKPPASPSATDYLDSLKNGKLWTPWLWLVVFAFVAFAALLSLRVDINEFSMHAFYRNRLVRCYLGASRPPDDTPEKDPRYHSRRQSNPFTGFDPNDDLPLKSLQLTQSPAPCAHSYVGPYPILNSSLNLVHGRRLAWQERKAESFSFTPLYCGGTISGSEITENTAYRKTDWYYPRDGVSLGTALAVSGAAVSPLVGFHYSSAAGFLLTVFNARLGQWLANPKSDSVGNRSGPRFGFWWMLKELFGLTDDQARYVNLVDGAQFENLGVYELVRRRVACIIVCDADADPERKFEDLGNAIRKCRSDFGVEIDIDLAAMHRAKTTPFSASSWARGTVKYPDAPEGDLLYLKASLTGREPSDVLEYHAEHGEFPDQSTADQWFDESQFESYRRLGQFVSESALAQAP